MNAKSDAQPSLLELDLDLDDSVEQEPEDTQLVIDRPFDPESIKVKTKPALVDSIVSRITHGEIDLAPDFQRHAGIWNDLRKGRLIESLLLRIPLPVFYVAADVKENWSVVDGLQRLTAINDFVNDRYPLSNLEYLSQLNGLLFSQLGRPMQRRIRETELVIHVIEPGTPEEVMFNIFRRINTGGMRLNGQEIRHAMHRGPARDFLKRLAETDEFKKATDWSVKPDRMADRECVLRFLAFRLTRWEDYRSNDLDGFLGETMRRLNEIGEDDRLRLEADFKRAMEAAHLIFGNDAFRKRYDFGAPRNPVSKALFEAWSVGLARASDSEIVRLVQAKNDVRHAFVGTMMSDRSFDVSISYSTGVPQRVLKRFDTISVLIKKTLQDAP
jgi:hypothetical protein